MKSSATRLCFRPLEFRHPPGRQTPADASTREDELLTKMVAIPKQGLDRRFGVAVVPGESLLDIAQIGGNSFCTHCRVLS